MAFRPGGRYVKGLEAFLARGRARSSNGLVSEKCDMDMLQLFASPAGRALLSNDNRPRGSTSTSSLSRESSSRLKSGRRPSGTGTVSAPTSPPRQRKSSAELYKEAVEILGLTCSLTDSCRCIDCQSNYFDCDDDCGDARTELAAGTPILLDHALSHPLTCSIQ
uniref:DUF4802 domain-containing protein n=1 Tax=Vespula pensylvanica TaxID=30213 RepID=A0A834U7S3_VESPE|nr:hypothetical protein H0235_010497 [Vespula pensylvanica]